MATSNTIKGWTFYKWILLIVALNSMSVWFFWGIQEIHQLLLPFVALICLFIVYFISPKLFYERNRKVSIIICSLFLLSKLWAGRMTNFFGLFDILISVVLVSFVVYLRKEYKKDLLVFLTKGVAILLGISLAGWFVNYFITPLPAFYDEFQQWGQKYINHFFFIEKDAFDWQNLIIPRFYGVFLEPGHLGTLIAVFLLFNNYNLKNRYVLILFIVEFFTFSVAGWLLTVFGYFMSLLKKSQLRVFHLILGVVIIIGGYIFFSKYNGGDNVVNRMVFDRLGQNRENIFVENNRTTTFFDKWFQNNFLKSSNILFGAEVPKDVKEGSVGGKYYFAANGVFGLILLFIYLFYVFIANKSYKSLILFGIYIGIFLNEASEFYWTFYPMLYILCAETFSEQKMISQTKRFSKWKYSLIR